MKIGYKKAFIIIAVAFVALVALNVYSIVAVPGPFTVPKPFSADLIPEVVFTVDSMNFVYDQSSQRITSCTVVVRNIHSTNSYSGTVTVTLKEATVNIASGSGTFTNLAATATVDVVITSIGWTGGKTLEDVDGGVVQVVKT